MGTLDTAEQHYEHPFRPGEICSSDDLDSLAAMLERVKDEAAKLKSYEYTIRNLIAAMRPGRTKTERVQGDRYVCKVVTPDDYWDQTTLKKLWQSDPQQSQVYLRIATLAPNLTEIKKMQNTNGNERFEAYKAELLAAKRPSNSPPSVTVELLEREQ